MINRLLIIAALLVTSHGMLFASPVSGHVKKLTGTATLTVGGKTEALAVNSLIPAGSTIQTDANSKVIVEWVPGAYSVVSASSSVVVGTLDYGTSAGAPQRKVALNIKKGSIFSHLVHNDGKSDFTIGTPKGVAAARGTDWVVTVNGESVTVSVLTSTVTFTTGTTTISITYGTTYTTGTDSPVPLTPNEIQAIEDALSQIPGLSFTTGTDGNGNSTLVVPAPAPIVNSQSILSE